MKVKSILPAALLLTLLSGCNFTQTSVDSLIKPPTLSKEQEEIYAAMQADPEVRNNVSLVYPKTGDYRSAYVIQDIDDEPSKEALVFYRENSGAATAGSAIKINVFDQVEDAYGNTRWVSKLISNEINATSVDKLSIIKIEGKCYIVIGFNLINADANGNTKEVKVFSYEKTADQGMQLVNKTSVTCVGYQVDDLDEDGKEDIVTIVNNVDGDQKYTYAKMYSYGDGQFADRSGTAPMESLVTEYTGIYKGKLEGGQSVLYLDGLSGKVLGTEILAVHNGLLVSLNPEGDRNLWELTNRPSEFSCLDLDQDGVFEIPKWLNVQNSDNQLDKIAWAHYAEDRLKPYLNTYTDYSLGYRLAIPESWMDAVGTKKDSTTNETTFYLYNPENLEDDSRKLLKIKVQTDRTIPPGYQELETYGELIYIYQKFPEMMRDTEYNITDAQLKRLFQHL